MNGDEQRRFIMTDGASDTIRRGITGVTASKDPYEVVRQFEAALCRYTGARYAVTVNSCTMALLIACAYAKQDSPEQKFIQIPRRTYVSVPMSIIHAGFEPIFRDEDWTGAYQLWPMPIYDCARRFTSGMYIRGQMQCVSFHWRKILGIQQGGAILHDNPHADEWLRRARFDGRREGKAPTDDHFDMIGWHAYMSPEIAAEGLIRLSFLPEKNADLPNDDYPDLSQMSVFK